MPQYVRRILLPSLVAYLDIVRVAVTRRCRQQGRSDTDDCQQRDPELPIS